MATCVSNNHQIVTFPPPVPPKSRRLLEKYRARNKAKLYENVDLNCSTANNEHGPENYENLEVIQAPVYDVVQFKARRCADPVNSDLDHNSCHQMLNTRLQFQNELEQALKTRQLQGNDGNRCNFIPSQCQTEHECGNLTLDDIQIDLDSDSESKIEAKINHDNPPPMIVVHCPELENSSYDLAAENAEIESHKQDLEHICDQLFDNQSLVSSTSGTAPTPTFFTRPALEENSDQDSIIVPAGGSGSASTKRSTSENELDSLYQNMEAQKIQPKSKSKLHKSSSTISESLHRCCTADGVTTIENESKTNVTVDKEVSFASEMQVSPSSTMTTRPISPPLKIHHVINLPPRKIQFIKKRRRRKSQDASYQKSSRLSQHMMTEYKITNTDRHYPIPNYSNNPTYYKPTLIESCKSNVGSVGRNVKKQIEYWYQKRVKTPIEQLSNEIGLMDNIVKLPHYFQSKSRGNANFSSSSTSKSKPTGASSVDLENMDPCLINASGTIMSDSQCSFRSQPRQDEDFSNKDVNDFEDHAASDEIVRAQETTQGQNEFEDLRKLVKQGGDFCKDLSAVLQERSELESQYAKGLSKLSVKLLKASKEATGSVAHAWQAVAVQIDTQAELHRLWSTALLDEIAKPLRNSTETQHKIRKSVETLVDKTTRNLAEWRTAETKAKRQCFSNSKEFEKLQESTSCSGITTLMSTTNLCPNGNNNMTLAVHSSNNNGTSSAMSNHSVLAEVRARSRMLSVPPTDKDPIKMETKRRKAEEAVRRADIEYYTFCVRAERARLEWEGSVRNGSTCLRTLEEEKLLLLKELALKYFQHFNEFIPKLVRSAESLEEPIRNQDIHQDMHSIVDIRRHAGVEQLLPDFYAEDTSNLMQKDRRKEALSKFVYLIKQDLEREKKGSIGIENLAKAIAEATKVDNAHHDISDKVYYMKSMLLYLEGAHYKIENVVADLEGRQRSSNPITQYMRYQRDKQGLPQTILKVPSWARDDCITSCAANSDSVGSNSPDWHECDRGAGDGTSKSHDTDFEDEFSSEGEHIEEVFEEVAKASNLVNVPSIGSCRVIYDYESNMFDELTIRCGEVINVHDKQEDGWWLGEKNGVIGIFPATYVEEVVEDTTNKLEIRI